MKAWDVDIKRYLGKRYYVLTKDALEVFVEGKKGKLTEENACVWALKHYIEDRNHNYSGDIVSVKMTPK